jgi:exodeoxyribonuclease V gamma subunit
LRSLIEFFGSPAKYFVRRRLELRLDEKDDALEDNEPFALDALERYWLEQEFVTHRLADQKVSLGDFAARGMLPLGEMGAAHFYTLLSTAEDFCKTVEPELRGRRPDEPLPIDLRIDPFSLTGQIESIYGGRIVQFRCASLKPKDRLRAWINHLARCATDSDAAPETVLIGIDEVVAFLPLKDPLSILAKLLGIYWNGLSRPLPFFPLSALEYATVKLSAPQNAKTSPLKRARLKWNDSWGNGEGEKSDPYYTFCFHDRDPLDEEFENLALEIIEPMLRNQRCAHAHA